MCRPKCSKRPRKRISTTISSSLTSFRTGRFLKPFDLIYSSDVFVYFGNLDPIIRSASSYLVHGGLIAFSVEKLEDDSTGYQLFPSGRFAHSHRYIRKCLKHHGFAPIEETDSVIRKQSGGEVKGLLIVAEKELK